MDLECRFRITSVKINFRSKEDGVVGGEMILDSDVSAMKASIQGKTTTTVQLSPGDAKRLEDLFKEIAFSMMPQGDSNALARRKT